MEKSDLIVGLLVFALVLLLWQIINTINETRRGIRTITTATATATAIGAVAARTHIYTANILGRILDSIGPEHLPTTVDQLLRVRHNLHKSIPRNPYRARLEAEYIPLDDTSVASEPHRTIPANIREMQEFQTDTVIDGQEVGVGDQPSSTGLTTEDPRDLKTDIIQLLALAAKYIRHVNNQTGVPERHHMRDIDLSFINFEPANYTVPVF